MWCRFNPAYSYRGWSIPLLLNHGTDPTKFRLARPRSRTMTGQSSLRAICTLAARRQPSCTYFYLLRGCRNLVQLYMVNPTVFCASLHIMVKVFFLAVMDFFCRVLDLLSWQCLLDGIYCILFPNTTDTYLRACKTSDSYCPFFLM
jgi:hypothetical protein